MWPGIFKNLHPAICEQSGSAKIRVCWNVVAFYVLVTVEGMHGGVY